MSIYNERLITIFQKKELDNLLANPLKYQKLKNMKLSRFNANYSVDCSMLVQLDALDNYIVQSLLENPSQINKNNIIEYRDYLYKLFLDKPMSMMDSILFQHPIAEKLFSTSQIESINQYKKKTVADIQNIYSKIMSKKPITKQEHDKYLIFLISQLENSSKNMQELLENSYTFMLQNLEHKSLLAKEFILKYTTLLAAKDNGLDHVNLYISNTHLDGSKYEQKTNGCCYGNTSIITINRDFVINEEEKFKGVDPIAKMMQTCSHETRHSAQAYQTQKNIFNYSSFEYTRNILFQKYMSSDQFNEYKTNYRHSEIESDSNIYGWKFTSKLLEKYAPQLSQNIDRTTSLSIVTDYSTALGNKTEGKKRRSKELYNVYYMDNIIRNYPTELQKYPLLQNIYNLDGTRKNMTVLLEIEKNNKDAKLKKIFNEYYSYDIYQGLLNTIDLNQLDLKSQFNIIEKFNEILSNEIKDLSHTITILNKNNKIEFEHISEYKMQKISMLINFFNNHQELINKLGIIDFQNNNSRAFNIQLGFTQRHLENLQHKIMRTDYLKDTTIYETLKEMNNVNYISPKK